MPHEHHELNRKVWNEMVEIHFHHPEYLVKEFLDGMSTLHGIEMDELDDVSGKTLLHLMCQFGLDTLSWARQGAIVTGVDISDKSIEYAHQLVRSSGIEGRFIRSDLFDLPDHLHDQFDIIFMSYGTHGWLSNLNRWAEVVVHFLKPGGVFYIVDLHPFSHLFDDDTEDYFRKGPIVFKNERDYVDKSRRLENDQIEFQHTLGDMVTAFINAGLRLEFLHEFDKCCFPRTDDWVHIGERYYHPPGGRPRYPLLFSMRLVKE